MLFSVVVASIGMVEQIHSLMRRRGEPLIDRIANQVGIPPLVVMVMILSIPAGLSTSIVSVAARSVLMQRTPPSARGQVVATQSLLQNVGALGPTLWPDRRRSRRRRESGDRHRLPDGVRSHGALARHADQASLRSRTRLARENEPVESIRE